MFSAGSVSTPLEPVVLAAICEMYPADYANLAGQFLTAHLSARQNTGAGFCTRFAVRRESCTAVRGERLRDGPQFSFGGFKYGMGLLLWLEERYAACLDGYSYGENAAALEIEKITSIKK